MTEPRGRHARWTAAALLAPASAAVFAGTMSWTTSHSPTAQAATTSEVTPAADPQAQLVQAQLAHRTEQVTALRKQVAALRKQLAAARAAAHGVDAVSKSTTTGAGTSTGSTARPTATATATSRTTTKPKVTKTAEPTVAPTTTTTKADPTTQSPAPATSATTGAS